MECVLNRIGISKGCLLGVVFGACALAGLARAASPEPSPVPTVAPPELVTDRPDQTESTAIVPPGYVQIETGYTHASDKSGGKRTRSDSAASTLLRAGLMRDLELRVGFDGYQWQKVKDAEGEGQRTDGAGDTVIGFKRRLWSERGYRPEAALLAHLTLPTGADAFSSGRLDPSFRFSFSHALTERLSLGYNLGMAWETGEDDTGDRDTGTLAQYTVTLGYALTDRLGVFVESFGDGPLNTPGKPAHSVDSGFTYLLRENLQLDCAAGRGISDDAEDWFVGVGISFRLPR